MKHLTKYKMFESSDIIIDTINDILIEVDNDIDTWSAKAFRKYEGEGLPDDITVIIEREGEFNEDNYPNEFEIIKHMRIPDEVFDAIKRMINYMGSYECDMFIIDDNPGPSGDIDPPHNIEIVNGKLVDSNGYYVDRLWYNECIKIVFSK